ncbi:Fumarate hydratase class II [Methylophaga thiooxydans]|uniref:Fumarate hydratase class II n=1 Tax=Methylophaga thiooxydans TaxID=392484 RepID=A0A0A0BIX9_9GAMM|nr:class II fumarate hydratase [Methylophaga thiooxydans]KGM07069.1 Fumarate hydratase class II [Methylophaga thiooxydans]
MTNFSHNSQHAKWGKQTTNALKHFRVGTETFPAELLHAYGMVKYCAAAVNQQQNLISSDIANAIMTAAQALIKGELDQHFPLSVWQSGSGTQTNMNVNEVLANIANHKLGSSNSVHANDHCNRSQSTNDSFPTALHIACTLLITRELLPALERLEQRFSEKADTWHSLIKSGRTHLQDATPITLGQEFSAFAFQIKQATTSIKQQLTVISELTIGGTAVGTGVNTVSGFSEAFCQQLNELTGLQFHLTQNHFASQASHDAIVQLSGSLNTLATALNKIASDIRLLASGPRCGLAELHLPANELGSSIMPGKVNPSQCEMLNMVCAQVMGNHTTITLAGAQGQLQLNTFKPVMAYNILQSLRLLTDAIVSFDTFCVQGIQANTPQLAAMMDKSLMLVTVLTPLIGYDKATDIVKMAAQNNTTLREEVLKAGLLTENEFDQLIRPEQMLSPKALE